MPIGVYHGRIGVITHAASADDVRISPTHVLDLVNTSLTLALENGVEISAFARNLFDERFITQVFDGVAQAGTVSGYPNQPRTYGGSVRFKF